MHDRGMTTPTGEPSQAAMEAARRAWEQVGGGAANPTVSDVIIWNFALALDLHAAAAVQEERARLGMCRTCGSGGNSVCSDAYHIATAAEGPEFRRGEVRGLKRMRSLVLGEFRDGIRDPEEIASAMSGLLDRYTSGSAEDGEGKAQNPNPSQQPTTGTGGER